jgi:hypothetical protein
VAEGQSAVVASLVLLVCGVSDALGGAAGDEEDSALDDVIEQHAVGCLVM